MCFKCARLLHVISFSEVRSCQTPSNARMCEASKTVNDCSLHTWHQRRSCKEFRAK